MEFIKQPILNQDVFGSSNGASCSLCGSNECVINACSGDSWIRNKPADLTKDESICWGKICRPVHLLPW